MTRLLPAARGSRVALASLPLALFIAPSSAAASAAGPTQVHWSCGCTASPNHTAHIARNSLPPSDCEYASNNTTGVYDPGVTYEIPIVWHVITNNGGQGNLTDQVIQDQIARLNRDFEGLTLGMGSDTGIRFRLATEDPNGMPTSGITRNANNTWFNDNGGYYNTLAWDPARYLNVYSLNIFFGAAGYVPDLPQSGIAGQADDRVVMNYQVIGNPQTEMILAHEVGHWLGLYHTFGAGQQGNCNNTDCTTQGDLICDTNPHAQPSQQCNGSAPCGVPAPEHNYMNYLDVNCMYEFTPIQIQRMRCSIENWRPMVATPLGVGTNYCTAVANSTGTEGALAAAGSAFVSSNDIVLTASDLPPNQFGIFVTSRDQGFVPGANGSSNGNLCLGGTLGRFSRPHQIKSTGSTGSFSLAIDLTALPEGGALVGALAGETWNFQAWHREGLGLGSNFTTGLSIDFR